MTVRIGIDVGGTKTEIIALDAGGNALLRRREATPVDDYAATLALIARLVHEAETAVGPAASVGIGTPGAPSPTTGLMRNSNSRCLNGKLFQPDIERALGREVRLANDANCFALSEAVDGAGRGAAVVFGVILGTGVGGGIVVDGRALTGPNVAAGEWGHNPLPWAEDRERPGPLCYCGKHGCIETFLSGPGLARDHEKYSDARLTADEITRCAADGDPAADATLRRYENRLARALASIINVLDPDVIVLGGGVSNVARLYDNVPQLWGRWAFTDIVRTRLVRNAHGDSGGVRGAAWL
ncbi:MAG TPA: ROK family protein [Burkholderiales bacterium]|nr:ROK family protein [Burkholderiales bacterium]